MYTYGPLGSDLHLMALGVVIWVVAISVAFGVYLPFHRARREATSRARPQFLMIEDDLDHAPQPNGTAAYGDLVVARAPAAADSPPAPPRAPAVAACEIVASGPAIPEAPTAPCRTPDQFSVLIVDDNAINRQVLEMILDSVGMAHVSVENGLEAVEAMKGTAYDAVLMDLQMPVMDGFEATRRIRELEGRRGEAHSTIIVVSANCLDEHVMAGREAGADAHLAKPISAGQLIGELASCPTLNRIAA